MTEGELLRRLAEADDLLPDARVALIAELKARGRSEQDIAALVEKNRWFEERFLADAAAQSGCSPGRIAMTPLPKELVFKCFTLIESAHKNVGRGNLPARVVQKEDMVALACVADALAIMGSAHGYFKLRILCWLAGLAVR